MCEMLGSEPLEDEIPVGRENLCIDTQMVFDLYDKLPSKWEGFSGHYMGKDLSLLPILFKEFNTDRCDRLYTWNTIPIIDHYVSEDIAKKIKSKTKGATSG